MRSYYSIVRFVNNPLSKENLAIGMVAISSGNTLFRFSKEKLKIAERISPSNFKLLHYTVDKISDYLSKEKNYENALFKERNSREYLERLSEYNNGILQFDKPSGIDLDFSDNKFFHFFEKYIELKKSEPRVNAPIESSFTKKLYNELYKPLKDVININYEIKKEQIPGLFFNYKLDGIGVNGSIYSIKSLDLNNHKPLDSYKKVITEFEVLNHRLELFASSKSLDTNKNNYLLVNSYAGTKPSYQKLHDLLVDQDENDYPYKVIHSDELSQVTGEIISSGSIIKFSDFLEQVGRGF